MAATLARFAFAFSASDCWSFSSPATVSSRTAKLAFNPSSLIASRFFQYHTSTFPFSVSISGCVTGGLGSSAADVLSAGFNLVSDGLFSAFGAA